MVQTISIIQYSRFRLGEFNGFDNLVSIRIRQLIGFEFHNVILSPISGNVKLFFYRVVEFSIFSQDSESKVVLSRKKLQVRQPF